MYKPAAVGSGGSRIIFSFNFLHDFWFSVHRYLGSWVPWFPSSLVPGLQIPWFPLCLLVGWFLGLRFLGSLVHGSSFPDSSLSLGFRIHSYPWFLTISSLAPH